MTTFGENRVQEAQAKAAEVPGATWHLVGHLQSNKAARAVELFDVVESVDSVELGTRLAKLVGDVRDVRDGRPLSIYLQVNVDRDPHKQGFAPDELEVALTSLSAIVGLDITGLMTVGRLVDTAEEARPSFRALRELSTQLRQAHGGLGAGLSMGMSDDFEVAVEEGATVVRVGRAIFGDRPPG